MTDTELRRLAENATPGPWNNGKAPRANGWKSRLTTPVWSEYTGIPMTDAAFIAAASPDVVLGLLDRCERAEKERSEQFNHHLGQMAAETRMRAELEDRIKALEVERDASLKRANAAEELHRRDAIAWSLTFSKCVRTSELDAMRAERDARPAIGREDAAEVCGVTWGPEDSAAVGRVREALRAHAAKGGE